MDGVNTQEIIDGILEHHGVLGMKWGHRRGSSSSEGSGSNKAATKRDFKKENWRSQDLRVGSSHKNFKDSRKDAIWEKRRHSGTVRTGYVGAANHKLGKAAAKSMKPEIKALNKKPEYQSKQAKREIKAVKYVHRPDPEKFPIGAKYAKEASSIYMKNIRKLAPEHMQTSPSGKWEEHLWESKSSGTWNVGVRNVKTKEASHANTSEKIMIFSIRPVYDEEGYITDFEVVDDSMAQSAIEDVLQNYGDVKVRR